MKITSETFQDRFGDTVSVDVWEHCPEYVYVEISEHNEQCQVELTLKQARKLRKALKKAIAAAESASE